MVILGMIAGVFVLRALILKAVCCPVGWTLVAVFFIILGTFSIFNGLTLHALSQIGFIQLYPYR